MDKKKSHHPLTKGDLEAICPRILTTLDGKQSYLVYHLSDGSFHVFTEVEAKQAAKNCGAVKEGDPEGDLHTRQFWQMLWEKY